MFEVSFVSAQGQSQRHVVKPHWMARQIARQAVANQATKVIVRLMRTDLYLLDPETGTIYRVCEKMTTIAAAKLSLDWTHEDRTTGIIMWPSNKKMPKRVTIERAG